MTGGPAEPVLERMLSASGFLLDFDGVIANSEPLFRKSWNSALEPWGHEVPPEDYWHYWSSLGEGLEGEIRRNGLDGIDIDLAARRQKDLYRELVDSGRIPLFPDSARVLGLLQTVEREAEKPFCIASNTSEELIRRILLHGDAPVPAVVGGDGLAKKPSPEIFLKAAENLSIQPAGTVVFEDSWKGVAAASKGGFASVLVLNEYNRELNIPADHRIEGMAHLARLLELVLERRE